MFSVQIIDTTSPESLGVSAALDHFEAYLCGASFCLDHFGAVDGKVGFLRIIRDWWGFEPQSNHQFKDLLVLKNPYFKQFNIFVENLHKTAFLQCPPFFLSIAPANLFNRTKPKEIWTMETTQTKLRACETRMCFVQTEIQYNGQLYCRCPCIVKLRSIKQARVLRNGLASTIAELPRVYDCLAGEAKGKSSL